MGDRNGDGRFADAARSDNRHEALRNQMCRYFFDRFVAPHHPLQVSGQLVRLVRENTLRARPSWRIRPKDRRHEAVASPSDSGHIPGSRLPVLKRPAQGGDMEPQVALIDRDIWPDSRHQLLLADNFAGAFDKNDKDVERSSTQMNWAARLLKASVRWAQAKWTERNKVRSKRRSFVSHPHSLYIWGNVVLLRVRRTLCRSERSFQDI